MLYESSVLYVVLMYGATKTYKMPAMTAFVNHEAAKMIYSRRSEASAPNFFVASELQLCKDLSHKASATRGHRRRRWRPQLTLSAADSTSYGNTRMLNHACKSQALGTVSEMKNNNVMCV
jgi:hypothetical protein